MLVSCARKGKWREANTLQVVTKIIKHGREAHFGTGTLLGLDFDGAMEVSNSCPLPGFSEEEDRGAKSAAQREFVFALSRYRLPQMIANVNLRMVEKYQRSMIHALKEVQGDENIVGFYQTTSVPLRQSLVETQATDYGKLRHGGIVIVHGALGFLVHACNPIIIRVAVMRCYTIEILTLLFRPFASQPWYRVLPRLPTNTEFPSCAQTKKVYDAEVTIYSSICISSSHHHSQPHRKQTHLLFDLRRAPCNHPYLRSRLCIPQHPHSPYESFEIIS